MISRRPIAIAAAPTQQEAPQPPSPSDQGVVGVNQLMLTSLPPMMSGADVYVRQFYRDSRLPSRRYLPIRGL